jgi:Family of unknown function (DUF6152)
MSNVIQRTVLSASILYFHAVQTWAHHSWAPYDLNSEVTLEGQIVEYKWGNPHTYIQLQTANADGSKGLLWEIEASSAMAMHNRGWAPDTVAAGDRVTIVANPSRNSNQTTALGARLALGNRLVTSKNVELEMRKVNSGAPVIVVPKQGSKSLAGQWRTTANPEASRHFFFFEPKDWPLTEAGVRAYAAFKNSDNPGMNCVPYAPPFLMVVNDAKAITLGKDEIIIRTELERAQRVIHMNETSHDGVEPSVLGHSIGRWEGDVLLVDTARFAKHGIGNAQKLPSGPDKRLTERFQLSADGTRIFYSFELMDPTYLAAPVSYKFEWVYSPDFEMVELPCDQESAKRYLKLQ